MEPKIHKSVMVNEVVDALLVKNQCKYIDCTLGTGGHTLAILENGGVVLGIDADSKMVDIARKRLDEFYPTGNFVLKTGNFTQIDKIAKEAGFLDVDGIILDLGVSNLHLKDLERGFSFENPDADLDMRLNPKDQGVKASDLLNVLRKDQLEDMFSVTLDGGSARWLTKRVCDARLSGRIASVGDFLKLTKGIRTGKTGLSEATLPFLALRIAVNSELENLKTVLPKAYGLLGVGGRLVVISFHSGEDKIVKDFAETVNSGSGKKLVVPSDEEIASNPRSRSAKMRIIQKI